MEAIRDAADPATLIGAASGAGKRILSALARWEQARTAFCERIAADPARFFALQGEGAGLAAQHRRLAAALDDEEGLKLFAGLGIYLHDADAAQCRFVYDACLAAGRGLDRMADTYELIVVRSLVRRYLQTEGAELERLGGLGLAAARKRFGELDDQLQKVEAKRILAKRLFQDNDRVPPGNGSGPRGTWTEKALLDHQLRLQRRHIPIRDLIDRAGTALSVLKPVWMMSPTSAAQFIKPGRTHFDLVLIDEASQMRPEYAVGSIARGAQLVVVGDSNQLPPTDFFNVAVGDGAVDEDEGGFEDDTESILDLANARLPHKRALNWHYRSEHESLIQFSNREFYERRLVVFPSPTRNDPLLGVQHRFVQGLYEGQVNEPEAKAVIEEAYGVMAARPELSIGIATMNLKQRELIRNEFERLEAQDPVVRDYLARHADTIEPFIIKNLETIQGDERDVILISTVYGPDRSGTVYQRFGPLNSKVGHRRLNVLVTRAKQMTRVVTSLRPDQIKALDTSSRGVKAMQAYLRHAAGGASFDTAGNGEADSDFELFVAERLRAAGYEVDHQVGVEGFRIDLGVRHPSFPLGYIAGVECDGAAFHSGLTVRDRDKIRQSMLERLGWRIHRVWSTDWFNSPQRETERLLEALARWREAAAAAYEARRDRNEFDEPSQDSAGEGEAGPQEVPPANLVPADDPFSALPHVTAPSAAADGQHSASGPSTGARDAPTGKRRELDGIAWFEVMRGALYEVWPDDLYAGDIEVLAHATARPRLYGGGSASAQRPQYRGTVDATGASFLIDDLYAAIRRIAAEARAARLPDLVPDQNVV
jgi:very-short-patch-repair endonuclease